jgi:hypothetical protein
MNHTWRFSAFMFFTSGYPTKKKHVHSSQGIKSVPLFFQEIKAVRWPRSYYIWAQKEVKTPIRFVCGYHLPVGWSDPNENQPFLAVYW